MQGVRPRPARRRLDERQQAALPGHDVSGAAGSIGLSAWRCSPWRCSTWRCSRPPSCGAESRLRLTRSFGGSGLVSDPAPRGDGSLRTRLEHYYFQSNNYDYTISHYTISYYITSQPTPRPTALSTSRTSSTFTTTTTSTTTTRPTYRRLLTAQTVPTIIATT